MKIVRSAVLALGLLVGGIGAGLVITPDSPAPAEAEWCYYDSYIHPHWHQWGPYPWQGYWINHEHQVWTCI